MKCLFVFSLLLFYFNSNGQVVLDADGPGNTYELITSILAPGYNPIEVPDCSHLEFGDHIDEIFDNELNTNVFRFHIHADIDNDRCINLDRQRNEIKAYDKSPDNLLGVEEETVVYQWKFKLEDGFQSSPNFTHIHQLKSVGGSLASMPMYTLTTRKGSPDRLELRYAETDSQITLKQAELAPFIGHWLQVTETIKYGSMGTYEIEIKRISDDNTLLSYSNDDIVNWRPGADFVRPKWGIYRSLLNAQDLRDEQVLFANFIIQEVTTSAINEPDVNNDSFVIFPNPVENTLSVKNIPPQASWVQVYSLDGKRIVDKSINANSELNLDVSTLTGGIYILNLQGKKSKQSALFLISNN